MAQPPPSTPGQHRYGIVLLLTIASVIDVIIAPDTPVSRGAGLLLQGTMLLAVIATSREQAGVRRATGVLAAAILLGLSLGVALQALPRWVGAGAGALAVIAVLFVLVRGVARLIRTEGVTFQAVAGALAIYMLVGLTFAFVINIIARIGPGYFAQGGDRPLSEQVYFSFTTMTTTGFGDLTPATNVGHALAVLEMLLGQIYLVTVIGLLVGNLNRGSRGSAAAHPGADAAR